MGTRTSNVNIIHEDTKVIKGSMLGKPFLSFDFNPLSPRAAMVGFAPATKKIAQGLATTFQYMADNCYKKEKARVKRRAVTKKKKRSAKGKVSSRRSTVRTTKKTARSR